MKMPVDSPPIPLSNRVAALQPSATLAMIGRVAALRAAGETILDLTAGEPDSGPPAAAEEAGIRAIREGRGRYTAAAGLMELREEIAGWIQEEVGLTYQASEIVVTAGAKIAINQALMAVLNPGDEVLIPAPYWTSYPEMVRLAGGTPVIVNCDAEYRPRVADLEKARTAKTRVLLLNTPNNPTGAVLPKNLLQEIGVWAADAGICVVSDEIYGSLTFGADHHSPLALHPALQETSFWISGVSKAFAMTGWRVGFIAARKSLAEAVARIQSQLVSSPPAISQHAALAALQQGAEARSQMVASFTQRRDRVMAAFAAMPGIVCPKPEGAFYAFPSVAGLIGRTDPGSGNIIQSGDDFAELLLEQDRVAVIGGAAFGDASGFRLSFAAGDEVLDQALERISKRIASLV